MRAFISLIFCTVFPGLCFAPSAGAVESGPALADSGYRPESHLSAAFIKGVSSAKLAVFPTIIRTSEDTSYSSASQQWVVEFLELNTLGIGKAADTRFDMGELQGTSQWEMFQSSMMTIGRQLGNREVQEDYAIVVEILLPPTRAEAGELWVFGVHCFVLDPDGANAFSFLLNSHHKAFNAADLRTPDLTAKGKEWLATEGTRLALLALKAQVDQDPGSGIHVAEADSTSLRTSMIDDFDSGLPSGADGVGLPIGFHTFSDATSTARILATTTHPTLPGEKSGNSVLQLNLNLTGWGGLIHSFENETMDTWVSHDWKAFLGVRFWLFGNNTGASLFVDVLDNRKRYSTSDDAERYTYQFRDEFAGWKQVAVPFAKMARKEIGNAAPSDGLSLSQVHGWAFGSSSSIGRIAYYIDDFELYGGRVGLPGEEPITLGSDSRWRALQATEGRFRVSVGVRMDPPSGMESSGFPKLAIFTWHYRAGLNGMPKNEEELLKILAWAARLDDLLVAEHIAFQFGKRGGAKSLRVYFYTADVDKLKELSLQAGERKIKTRVDFSASDDPNWEEWRKMGRPPEGERKSAGDDAGDSAVPVSAMDSILRFDGFSVRRPNDYRWRLIRNYQTPYIASFSFAPLSPTHSFNASILIRGLPKEFRTQESFKAFIDSKLQESGPRFEMLSFDSSMTQLHGQWAINYKTLFLDRTPANSETALHMATKGIVFLHPLRKRRVIDAFYSERGTAEDLDGKLDPVGEDLINGTIPER